MKTNLATRNGEVDQRQRIGKHLGQQLSILVFALDAVLRR